MSLLTVRDLSVRFGGVQALDSVGLELNPGEIVGLIGPNGAGKTTLLDVITGENAPIRGRIDLDGEEITGLSAFRRARRGIGRTFQAPDLVGSLTVHDNLMLGCQARQRTSLIEDGMRIGRSRRAELLAAREVARVLDMVGIRSDAGRPVAQLPLGRRRLVEIARALCAAPRLLLLDEAGSGMSSDDLATLAALLRRLTQDQGLAVLLIEHDVEFVFAVCDFVYVMTAGRLIARGEPDGVCRHPDVIDAYTGELEEERVDVAG